MEPLPWSRIYDRLYHNHRSHQCWARKEKTLASFRYRLAHIWINEQCHHSFRSSLHCSLSMLIWMVSLRDAAPVFWAKDYNRFEGVNSGTFKETAWLGTVSCNGRQIAWTSKCEMCLTSGSNPTSCRCVLETVPWASYQIRKIAGCAYAENAGNIFPATAY